VVSLGSAHLWSGRTTDAVPLLEEAVEAFTARGMLGPRSLIITSRAEAELLAGRVAEAREQAERAVALACDHRLRSWEALALKVLGDVHAHAPAEAEQAGDAYRQALVLATELGLRPLVAHCHLGLGKLYRRTGKREQAQEHLRTATTMYRDMDIRSWREQAEVEMGGLV
jgi:tetratricopeptide (TPR) repeat protein